MTVTAAKTVEPGPPCDVSGPLRVLLFSPLRGYDPLSGDTSYTEALLSDPPPGVVYTTYRQAIEDGTLKIRGRKPWHSGTAAADAGLFAARAAELALRRTRLMFREYVSYVTIQPGAYDLIHQHLFAIGQIGSQVPVVSGAGYPLTELYHWRERWGPRHLRVALALEAALVRAAGVHNPWLQPAGPGMMTVYGEHFRSWLIDRGVPARQVQVVGTCLPELHIPPKRSDGHTLGVIGRDFWLKGGDIALEAFRSLRASDPRWRLIVATTATNAAAYVQPGPGIEIVVDPSRDALLNQLLPRIDVLLAPTRSDCGVPYAMLEALQAGTPIVTSELPWLDERLPPPAVRKVPATPDRVADAVGEIVANGLDEAQGAARRLWEDTFSMPAYHRDVLAAYSGALDNAKGSPRPRARKRLRVLVAARPEDLVDRPFSGFVTRHRRIVRELAGAYDVTVLNVQVGGDVTAPSSLDGLHAWLPDGDDSRVGRLREAWRHAKGIETEAERALAAAAAGTSPDVVVTLGPWLNTQYRPLWRRWPSVHFFEEDLARMVENAPQSFQARALRMLQRTMHSLARAQPSTVVSISRAEEHAARRWFRGAALAHLPFTLDPVEWPSRPWVATGDWVLAVGNFAEPRNADGLADVLAELRSRSNRDPIAVRIVSGPGLHPRLHDFVAEPWLSYAGADTAILDEYDRAWATLVPAMRVTGQKTTILQGWTRSVPVVASSQAAATVDAAAAVAIGADAAGMVDRLIELRADACQRQRLAVAGRAVLSERFDPFAERLAVRRLIEGAAIRAGR